MKFAVLIVLLFTVVSVYGQASKAPAGSTAPAAATPKITTTQIAQMLTALNKILGPEMAKNVVSMVNGSGLAGGVGAAGGLNQKGPTASGTGVGAGAGSGSGSGSGTGSGAGSGSGSGCACLFHPIFTIG